ncbi:MAG TPA: ATP-binding protein [Ignavibacteria bacterium]|nr:ATP-binding protein [Ignavibacteria bacterium]
METSNPFKFGSVVDEPYFTNRVKELKQVKQLLQSQNHLILISPRRYGKTSLILKAVNSLSRPYIFLDLQLVTGIADFAAQLLKRIYRVYPFEKIKQFVKNFRIVPTLNVNPVTNEVDIGFIPKDSEIPMLEDVFHLIDNIGKHGKKPIVILDEFQEIFRIDRNLDKLLRATLQHHKHVNYAFLGSMETMMREIFEKKKSPFYHFGQLIPLDKIPYKEFFNYLSTGFNGRCDENEKISEAVLNFTGAHPYYTQQLAFTIWEDCNDDLPVDKQMEESVVTLINIHDVDYERLWQNLNQTDRKIIIVLAMQQQNILSENILRKYGLPAASTVYSSLKRLMQQGYVIKSATGYELDDPFFARWIKIKREQ